LKFQNLNAIPKSGMNCLKFHRHQCGSDDGCNCYIFPLSLILANAANACLRLPSFKSGARIPLQGAGLIEKEQQSMLRALLHLTALCYLCFAVVRSQPSDVGDRHAGGGVATVLHNLENSRNSENGQQSAARSSMIEPTTQWASGEMLERRFWSYLYKICVGAGTHSVVAKYFFPATYFDAFSEAYNTSLPDAPMVMLYPESRWQDAYFYIVSCFHFALCLCYMFSLFDVQCRKSAGSG
jgi:hypothetical protein